MQNFEAFAEAFVRAGGAIQVQNEDELCASLADLLAGPERQRDIAARALEVIQQSTGATERTAEAILQLLQRNHSTTD